MLTDSKGIQRWTGQAKGSGLLYDSPATYVAQPIAFQLWQIVRVIQHPHVLRVLWVIHDASFRCTANRNFALNLQYLYEGSQSAFRNLSRMTRVSLPVLGTVISVRTLAIVVYGDPFYRCTAIR